MSKERKPFIKSRPYPFEHKIPISKTLKYWEGLKEGKIYKTICKKCGKQYYPPQADCSLCGGSEMEWKEIEGIGEIETFTQIHTIPTGFEWSEPYIIAVARFGEVRVMGWYLGKVDDIKVGTFVKASTWEDPGGMWKVVFSKVE